MAGKNQMVPDAVLKFNLNGQPKQVDYQSVPFNAWSELKQATGFTPRTLVAGIGDVDLDAIVSLIWLERKQRERRLNFIEVRRDLTKGDTPAFEMTDMIIDGVSYYGEEDDDGDDDTSDPTTGVSN